MKISYKRTGGLGGLTKSADVDTSDLKKSEAQKAESLAKAVLAAKGGKSPDARDAMMYTFVIDGEQRIFDDTTLPDEARALGELILKLK